MPAKKTTPAAPATMPGHFAELCALCGQHPVPDGATSFTCEHGTWDLTAVPTGGEQTDLDPAKQPAQ